MGEKALINAKQIRQAREALALPLEEAALLLKIQPQKLQEWEQGASEPSSTELQQLAQLYGRSIDYFLTSTPPFPKNIALRSPTKQIEDLDLKARKDLVKVEEFCRAYRELEVLLKRSREIKLKSYSKELRGEELAVKVRQDLSLREGPIKGLPGLLRKQGILVWELGVSESAFSGFSFWHEEYGPVILVNRREFFPRRRFTLAHEYAHLLCREGAMVCGHELDLLPKLDTVEERLASRFAAAFLIPASDLKKQFEQKGYKTPPDENQVGALARRYNVSLEALTIRLEELGLAPEGFADEFVEKVAKEKGEKFPWRFRPPRKPPWEQKFGREYCDLAFQAYQKGLISIGRLAYYLDIDIKTAMELVEQL